jgi:glycerol uptake facilitator-like aquaporin
VLGLDLVYAWDFQGAVDWLAYLLVYALAPILGALAAVWLYHVLARQPEDKPAPS